MFGLFKKAEPRFKQVILGKGVATITTVDNVVYTIDFVGKYTVIGGYPHHAVHRDAKTRYKYFLQDSKTFITVNDTLSIPTANIKTVTFEETDPNYSIVVEY